MQNWRAVANTRDGKQALICLGKSQAEVMSTFKQAFVEVIHPEVRQTCRGITLQRWVGRIDRGQWGSVANLSANGR